MQDQQQPRSLGLSGTIQKQSDLEQSLPLRDPTFRETVMAHAAFNFNPFLLYESFQDGPVDPNFKPMEHPLWDQVPRHRWKDFTYAVNDKSFMRILTNTQIEDEALGVIERASGVKNVVAALGAGAADPTILADFVLTRAAILRRIKDAWSVAMKSGDVAKAKSLAAAYARGSMTTDFAMAAGAMGLAEIDLQMRGTGRTTEESATAIALGGGIGMVFGRFINLLAPENIARLQRGMENFEKQRPQMEMALKAAQDLAAEKSIDLEDASDELIREAIERLWDTDPSFKENMVAVHGPIGKVIPKPILRTMQNWISPFMRAYNSRIPTMKSIAHAYSSIPLARADIDANLKSAFAMEVETFRMENRIGVVISTRNDGFRKIRARGSELDYKELDELTTETLRRRPGDYDLEEAQKKFGDKVTQEDLDEVGLIAEEFRAVQKEIEDFGIKFGAFERMSPQSLLTKLDNIGRGKGRLMGYWHRRYNNAKLMEDEAGFKGLLREWREKLHKEDPERYEAVNDDLIEATYNDIMHYHSGGSYFAELESSAQQGRAIHIDEDFVDSQGRSIGDYTVNDPAKILEHLSRTLVPAIIHAKRFLPTETMDHLRAIHKAQSELRSDLEIFYLKHHEALELDENSLEDLKNAMNARDAQEGGVAAARIAEDSKINDDLRHILRKAEELDQLNQDYAVSTALAYEKGWKDVREVFGRLSKRRREANAEKRVLEDEIRYLNQHAKDNKPPPPKKPKEKRGGPAELARLLGLEDEDPKKTKNTTKRVSQRKASKKGSGKAKAPEAKKPITPAQRAFQRIIKKRDAAKLRLEELNAEIDNLNLQIQALVKDKISTVKTFKKHMASLGYGSAIPGLQPGIRRDRIFESEQLLEYLKQVEHSIERSSATRRFMFHTGSGTERLFRSLRADYDKLKAKVKTPDERRKLERQFQRNKKDIQNLHRRFMVQPAYRSSGPEAAVMRGAEALRTITTMNKMGGVTLTSTPDAANGILLFGLRNWIQTLRNEFDLRAFLPQVFGGRYGRPGGEDALDKDWLAFNEWAGESVIGATRSERLFGFEEWRATTADQSPFEDWLARQRMHFSNIVGINWWNSRMQMWAAFQTQRALINAALRLKSGIPDPRTLKFLEQNGVTIKDLEAWAEQLSIHGEKVKLNGKWKTAHARVHKWTDPVAANRFHMAMIQFNRQTLLTGGVADLPLIFDVPTGQFIFQFKSFLTIAAQRIMFRDLQRLDGKMLANMALLSAFGAMTYTMKSYMAGRDPFEDDIDLFAQRSIDASGLFALPFELNEWAEKLSGNRIGLTAMTGSGTNQRATGKRIAEMGVGANFKTLEQGGNAFLVFASLLFGERPTKAQIKNGIDFAPYQNLAYIRYHVDQLSEWLEGFGR